jgi:hypothetical protein
MMHRNAKWQHGQRLLLLHCRSWTQKHVWHWQGTASAAMYGYGSQVGLCVELPCVLPQRSVMLSNCYLAYYINGYLLELLWLSLWLLSVSRAWNVLFSHGVCTCTVPAGRLNTAGIGRTRRGQLCADTADR